MSKYGWIALIGLVGMVPLAQAADYSYDAEHGEMVYEKTCGACHKSDGQGLEGSFPPLAGNPVVTQDDATRQIKTALFGKQGPLTVNGVDYNGFMPPFGGNLSDRDAADLINYERSSWGNDGRHVTPDEVADVRAAGE